MRVVKKPVARPEAPVSRPIAQQGPARQTLGRYTEPVMPMPNLNQIQHDSFNWFLEEGLQEVLNEVTPITRRGA